jgi:uncharacterized protein YvpB
MRSLRLLLLALILLPGLAVSQETSPGIWLDVPFVNQTKDGCGSASVSMLMQYWAAQTGQATPATADAAQIQSVLYSDSAHGIYASQIEHYLQQHGFRVFTFSGEYADLRQHLEKGRPMLVAVQPGNRAPLHYEVVVGLNWKENTVLLNDPAQRKLLKQDWPSFERQWSAAGKWMLLALPQPSR